MGSNNAYYAFHDGKDGYWWGFQHYSNGSGSAVIQWIKIDKTDYSFTEGVWSFENVPMYSVGSFSWNSSSYNATYTYSTIRDGYLYVYNNGRTGLYKININNVADISYIPFGFQSRSSSASLQMYVLNGFVKGPEFVLDADDNVTRVINSEVLSSYVGHLFENGVYLYAMGNYRSNSYYYCYYGIAGPAGKPESFTECQVRTAIPLPERTGTGQPQSLPRLYERRRRQSGH